MSSEPDQLDRLRVRFATFRERPASARAELANRLASIQADERVLVDTCHRVELVSLGGPASTDDGVVEGRDAVRRVFTVVAGFDSAVLAEEQLIGQVRDAFEAALGARETGPILNELFRRALRFGRRVRSYAVPGTDRSLADPGVAWLVERLPDAATVAVVGTGEMGRLVGARLAARGHRVVVVSRSEERGRRMVEAIAGAGHRVAVGPLASVLRSCDGVALAVRATQPVLGVEGLPPGARLPWVLDLSVPSAVTDEAIARLGDRFVGVDHLAGAAARPRALAPAVERRLRDELEVEVERFVSWLASREGADALAVLHDEAEAVRRRHLDRLRRRAALDGPQLAAVEAAAAAMLGELLHGPSQELRRGGADAATVRRLFGLDA